MLAADVSTSLQHQYLKAVHFCDVTFFTLQTNFEKNVLNVHSVSVLVLDMHSVYKKALLESITS